MFPSERMLSKPQINSANFSFPFAELLDVQCMSVATGFMKFLVVYLLPCNHGPGRVGSGVSETL